MYFFLSVFLLKKNKIVISNTNMLEKARILLKNKWIIDGSDNNILIQEGGIRILHLE